VDQHGDQQALVPQLVSPRAGHVELHIQFNLACVRVLKSNSFAVSRPPWIYVFLKETTEPQVDQQGDQQALVPQLVEPRAGHAKLHIQLHIACVRVLKSNSFDVSRPPWIYVFLKETTEPQVDQQGDQQALVPQLAES
jgi:hypothetical protein